MLNKITIRIHMDGLLCDCPDPCLTWGVGDYYNIYVECAVCHARTSKRSGLIRADIEVADFDLEKPHSSFRINLNPEEKKVEGKLLPFIRKQK